MNLLSVVAAVYGLLCLAALLLIPASLYGWFGVARGPLGAVFAILLGMPWTLALKWLDPRNPWLSASLIAAGMAINIFLLIALGRWIDRLRGR